MVTGTSGLTKMTAQCQGQSTSQFADDISLIEKHRARPTPDQVAAARDLSLFVKQLCGHFLFDALNPTLKPGLGTIM
jgi:hypothetical protein